MSQPFANFDGFVIDAAQYAKWDRSIFKEMRDGGVTCVNATIVYWESARETLSEIGKWNRLFEQNSDLIFWLAQRMTYAKQNRPAKQL